MESARRWLFDQFVVRPKLRLELALARWRWASSNHAARRLIARAALRYPFARSAYAMAGEGIPGYLRYRVINRALNSALSESFESRGATVNQWRSLGTEAGTDNSINYWATDAGSPSYASHVLTLPAAARVHAGNSEWGDCVFTLRFTYNSGGHQEVIIHFTDTNNFIYADITTNQLNLRKVVGGTDTLVIGVTPTLTNTNNYWIQMTANGTLYNAVLYNDSAGAMGTAVTSGSITSASITNAILQSGYIGAWAVTTSMLIGGAFANVCTVTNSGPIGTAQWNPVIVAGEPAFAWTSIGPYTGVWSVSIQLLNSGGSGAWQEVTAVPAAPNAYIQAQVKATAGSPTVSGGGLTTAGVSADSAYHQALSAVGALSASPTLSCSYSGAVGTAHFDALGIAAVGGEITSDLPHLHTSTWSITAMLPGNPSSATVGSFSIPLHPPGTPGYDQAKPIYDQLDYFQRVEGYLSLDGTSLGNLKFAGVITGIEKSYGANGDIFLLTGQTDLALANLSRPFPGELLSNQVTSSQIKSFMGVNELGAADGFNPYVAANYTSTFIPGGGNSAGTWTATTDDSLNVVTTSTGSGAALISLVGAAANDGWHLQFAECTGRLKPSSDANNAGVVGIGLSRSNTNCNDCVMGHVVARLQNGRYVLDATIVPYVGGAQSGPAFTQYNVLANVDDPQAFIPLTVGLMLTVGGASGSQAVATLIVNGKVVIGQYATGFDPGFSTMYPFLHFSVPGSGTANAYLTNLVQLTRFTPDGPSAASAFAPGSISTSTHSLTFGTDPGPTFLDVWSRTATREGWFWRYTPQPYVSSSRTLGVVDFAADPGTDRSTSCIFRRRLGNLVSLRLTANADRIASDTAITGQSTLDGGGIGFWRDIGAMTKYGVIQDEALAFTHSDFNTLRRASLHISQRKTNTGGAGSKTAVVQRDAATVDQWRELDKVLIDDPELGINNVTARVIGYTFTEGDRNQTMLLDEFSDAWSG